MQLLLQEIEKSTIIYLYKKFMDGRYENNRYT